MNSTRVRSTTMAASLKTRPMSRCLLLLACMVGVCGCGSIRVTNSYYTATQLYLESEAARKAVANVTVNELRDRKVYVDTTYLTQQFNSSPPLSFSQIPQNYLFLVADLRSKLLLNGVRLVDSRRDAEIVLEVRTGGIGVDEQDFLIGLSSLTVPTEVVASVPLTVPELAILKIIKQFGFASVAVVAYWQDTGEIIASSGPFVGRTAREDYWICGIGPTTAGDIAPAEKAPPGSGP